MKIRSIKSGGMMYDNEIIGVVGGPAVNNGEN
jgi:hypothetical protein